MKTQLFVNSPRVGDPTGKRLYRELGEGVSYAAQVSGFPDQRLVQALDALALAAWEEPVWKELRARNRSHDEEDDG